MTMHAARLSASRRLCRHISWLAILLLPLLGACSPSLRVMSFNVRYASDVAPHQWAERRPVMVALIRRARPDVIGTQELLQRQGDDLVGALPRYRWFGVDRRGGHGDEHMGIFYRPDRLALVSSRHFWLSESPQQPNSMSWGTDLPRMVAWAVFETRSRHPRRFVFLDTHFAHRDQDVEARQRSAELIVSQLASIARGLPVVLAGDLNTEPSTGAYQVLARELSDAWVDAPRRAGPAETFHDFTGVANKRIDYIFVRDLKLHKVEVLTDHRGAIFPSDHFPVIARVTLGNADRR